MSAKKEIEIKYRIRKKETFDNIFSQLSSEATLFESVEQHDVYYSPEQSNYMDEKYPFKWLRIRYLNDDRAEICFKHFYPEGAEKHIYCDEYQTEVIDAKAMNGILKELGFIVIADVDKQRETLRWGRYLVSFDTVKDLGWFIEVEVEKSVFDEDKERLILGEVVNALGLSNEEVDFRGYPFLIYEERHC